MENKYFGSKFYSSTLNTILLFVLIILMIVALRFMYKNQETYLPILQQEEVVAKVDDIKSKDLELNRKYENKEIGFSIEYPSKYGDIKTSNEVYLNDNPSGSKFIIPGKDKGEAFRGYIGSSKFYFIGLSSDYQEGRGMILGESKSNKCADNPTNVTKNGDPYKYELFKEEEPESFFGIPSAYIASFHLKSNNDRFPCLSFVFIPEDKDTTEAEFIKIMDSVKIN